MLAIFLKTLPFFLLIGLGWLAARLRIFPPDATAWLTRFVFYFPLSAMLFQLTVDLPLAQIWDADFALAYMLATGGVFGLQFLLSRWRGAALAEASIEAQCAAIGNTGFLGIPMLAVLLGPSAAGPILLVLTIDMLVFSTLVTLLITAARGGTAGGAGKAGGAGGVGVGPTLVGLIRGVFANPMIMAMAAGLGWGGLHWPLPGAVQDSLALLAAAATPCALFAIGAALAERGTAQLKVASGLSLMKLVVHPAAVAVMALWVFPVAPSAAHAMIAAAALPVAGNIYILAQHYGVAPQRVSTSILLSTAASILTIPAIIAWVTGL